MIVNAYTITIRATVMREDHHGTIPDVTADEARCSPWGEVTRDATVPALGGDIEASPYGTLLFKTAPHRGLRQ